MSGGKYDYAYEAVESFAANLDMYGGCYAVHPRLRKELKKHLELVARAMQACEWNDSGDGDPDELQLIPAVLGDADALEVVRNKRKMEAFRRRIYKGR